MPVRRIIHNENGCLACPPRALCSERKINVAFTYQTMRVAYDPMSLAGKGSAEVIELSISLTRSVY